jgi:hypothetical protein
LTLALAAPALAADFPDPPATQSINCQHDGPKACARLKLLRNLFGPKATSVPLNCHFSHVVTPENPDPPYTARHLALVCLTGGAYGNGNSVLYFTDGARPDGNVRTTDD